MIDIGVNLTHRQFERDRAAVLERAARAGVTDLLITGISVAESQAAAALCSGTKQQQTPRLYSTAGVHPHEAAAALQTGQCWIDSLCELSRHPAVVAIGETGLDFFRDFSPRTDQRAVFDRQIALAVELDLPLFVHDRDSKGEVNQMLRAAGQLPPTVIHCFTGSRSELLEHLDAGFYIGVTGWIADARRGDALRQLVPLIPEERLLVETDAPFLRPHNAPAGFPANTPDRRNEPALLRYVVAAVAECRQTDPATLAALTARNARALFRLPEPV